MMRNRRSALHRSAPAAEEGARIRDFQRENEYNHVLRRNHLAVCGEESADQDRPPPLVVQNFLARIEDVRGLGPRLHMETAELAQTRRFEALARRYPLDPPESASHARGDGHGRVEAKNLQKTRASARCTPT